MRLSVVARCVLASVACASAVLGEQAEPVRLIYSAPETCPRREEVVRQLRARSDRVRFAADDELAQALVIEVRAEQGAFAGSFALEENAGAAARRFLQGEDCERLVSALVLTAALAVDPQARLELAPEIPSEPSEPSEPAAAPPPAVPPKQGPEPVPAGDEQPVPPAPASPRRMTTVVATGARLEAQFGIAPRVVGVPRFRWGIDLPPLVSLGLAVGAGTSTARADLGSAELTLLATRVEACLASVEDQVAFGPCLGIDLGALWAAPQGRLDTTTSSTRPWVTPTLAFRAAWRSGAGGFPCLQLEGFAGAGLPTQRSHYFFRSDATIVDVYTVPIIGVVVGAGVGVLFGDRHRSSRQ